MKQFQDCFMNLNKNLKSKMNYEEFQKKNNLRKISPNEIVLDCDCRENGDLGIRRVCMVMGYAGYRIEIYKAEGQKSYHSHIKDIPHINTLSKEQNKEYKELILKKYVAKVREFVSSPELDKIDFTLCVYEHLVAEEYKPHFKYKTIKKLIAVINEELQNFCEKDIYEQVQQKKEYKLKVKGSGITAEITRRVSIIDLARKYGIEVDRKGKALCPFHSDNNTLSLKFYEKQGRFCCFGCNVKGNIIDFLVLLKLNGIQKIK